MPIYGFLGQKVSSKEVCVGGGVHLSLSQQEFDNYQSSNEDVTLSDSRGEGDCFPGSSHPIPS